MRRYDWTPKTLPKRRQNLSSYEVYSIPLQEYSMMVAEQSNGFSFTQEMLTTFPPIVENFGSKVGSFLGGFL